MIYLPIKLIYDNGFESDSPTPTQYTLTVIKAIIIKDQMHILC